MKCDELTPIDLECNLGKDINGVEHREPWKAYDIDEVKAAIQELKSEADAYIRKLKYKRCLAMASYWVAVSFQCVDDKHRQSAERHHRKWLELAEKFKPNNEVNNA